jgi:fumarylacetoacetase
VAHLNETHDPQLRSWVDSANKAGTAFPIQNLPLGVFRRGLTPEPPRVGVAIGDAVLDLRRAHRAGLFDGDAAVAGEACTASTLNPLLALGRAAWSVLRRRTSELLRDDRRRTWQKLVEPCLVPMNEAVMQLPAAIGDYTDFYASIFHATNVGSMFRPDEPLLPNYKYVPIGYHGRASSVVVSGTPVRRPIGQSKPESAAEPIVGPSRRLDYELEVGFLVGPGNALGTTIPVQDAEGHLFGVCLVNDWSARDLQAWEYQPLGPFLAKSFATSISPWVVTLEALEPFRVPAFIRPDGDPNPLPYLDDPSQQDRGAIDLRLEVSLLTAEMRQARMAPFALSRSSLRYLYWTPAQLLAHHASAGCNLRPGDLLASGTVSGPTRESRGCLLELAWRGTQPITLPTGETRSFLADGDEVILRGWCERERFVRIGCGECRGVVDPAMGERD